MKEQYSVIPDYINKLGKKITVLELSSYPGVLVSYDNACMVEVADEEVPMLNFNYYIHEGVVPEDEKILFKKLVGDILVDIIIDGLKYE